MDQTTTAVLEPVGDIEAPVSETGTILEQAEEVAAEAESDIVDDEITETPVVAKSTKPAIERVRFEGTDLKKVYNVVEIATDETIGQVRTDDEGYGIVVGTTERYWNRKTAGAALLVQLETGVRPMPAAKGPGFFEPSATSNLVLRIQGLVAEAQAELEGAKKKSDKDYAAGRMDAFAEALKLVQGELA